VDDVGCHSGVFQAGSELLGGLLAGLVFILIQDEVDRAAWRIGKLAELGRREMCRARKWCCEPDCHSTARSDKPSTRITVENWPTDRQQTGRLWNAAVNDAEGRADAAAVEIHDLTPLAAGRSKPAEGVAALLVDEALVEKQSERIALAARWRRRFRREHSRCRVLR
jgi:hypothetical protein